MTTSTLDERLIQIRPSERQLAQQQMEFYAFVHFTVNTFTDKEWGDGTENPKIFNPQKLDAEQWCKAIKSAGMTGLILTCKHHDGFCLWPSKFTNHSIAASPFRDGKGDIVAETATACKKFGLKFGIYLSPWDKNSKLYGQGRAYDDYFIAQLTELLTNYGPIFSVCFDGACGEGPNGKKQVYDFPRYYEVVRKLQPDACISICGPDVRWCGNEAGHCRQAEWSVVPLRTKDTEIIKERSQHEDSAEFRQREIFASDEDLGSRKILENEPDLIWYPAEVNTSIRPGWFYHKSEDDKVRPLEELIDIYYKSVGGNATFLLNIPPTQQGLFHQNDVKRLQEIGDYLRAAFGKEVARADFPEYYKSDTGFVYELGTSGLEIRHIVLQEDISQSQRVEGFKVEVLCDDGLGEEKVHWQEIYTGSVIGYKKIIRLENPIKTDRIRFTITDCRCQPVMKSVIVY